jgi:hypothetical protein
MAYSKTTWVTGTTPVSAANLNNLETQYDDAVADSFTETDMFIPFLVGLNTPAVYPTYVSETVGFSLDAAAEAAKTTFVVPNNFGTLVSAIVRFVVSGGSNDESVDWTFNTHWGATGEENDNDTDSVTENAKDIAWTTPPALKIYEIDVTDAFTGIVADDHCYAELVIDALGGTSPAIIVTGILFTYTKI